MRMCEELVSVSSFLLELTVLSKQMMKIKDGKYYDVEQLTSSVALFTVPDAILE